ncbi:MAG TPA: hypothetical protein VMH00_02330 [Candidatus Limnocylindrales bacterium]|nr:hypothetical protein [Candidatus Limnocylindrales bacterium]
MSRDFYPDSAQDTRDEARRTPSHHCGSEGRYSPSGRGSGESSLPDRQEPEAREQRVLKPDREDSPRAYYLRDREYLLRESEIRTLSEVGRFRVVAPHDLAKYGYGGDSARMERDIRRLREQSLLSAQTLEISGRKTLRVVTLTKQGAKLLRSTNRIADEQEIYHGLRKPKEAKHDADLYRLYQKEAARIEHAGGRPLRVILDYELKRDLNRDLEALGPHKDDPEIKQAVAEKHHLPVVNGKVQLPDLRIEYENAQGELDHTDAELATRHYRPHGLAAKARAGFSLYSHPEDASRLRRILNDQDLTAGILSL